MPIRQSQKLVHLALNMLGGALDDDVAIFLVVISKERAMKQLILATIAATTIAVQGDVASAPRMDSAASSSVVPAIDRGDDSPTQALRNDVLALFANAAVARNGAPHPADPPAFKLDGLKFFALSIEATSEGDWYVQCVRYPNGHMGCRRIIRAKEMRGLEVRTAIASDGVTPLTFFTQTTMPATPGEADHQSFMIGVFNLRYGQVIAELRG